MIPITDFQMDSSFTEELFIPPSFMLHNAIVDEFHSTPSGIHSGVKPTISKLNASFSWPTLDSNVKTSIKRCSVCHHHKYQTQKKKGLLQPLPTPNQVWEDLFMDFVTHFPTYFSHIIIWVIYDRLNKYVNFIALPTRFTAQYLAHRFFVEICRLHGVHKSIVSDRDPLFLSAFWKQLFKVQGTKLKYNTSYHPETGGQIEVVNGSLQTYLRCFVSDHPCYWFKFRHLAEIWHNTSYHSTNNMTPFQALYGRPPPTIQNYISILPLLTL